MVDSSKIDQSTSGNKLKFIASMGLFLIGLLLFNLTKEFPDSKLQLFFAAFGVTFAAMMGMRYFWPQHWHPAIIILIALFARIALLQLEHSDDLNRYLWEGNCQLKGLNPYSITPDNFQTVQFRDTYWNGVNHKDFTTIYGPVAQIVFAGTVTINYSPLAMKIAMVLFDMGVLYLLLLFLQKRKSRFNELFLYAANPLVLYSFAVEGHMESLLLFMLAGTVVCFQRKKYSLMYLFLGNAALVKITALMFIPLMIRRDTLRYLPWIIVPLLTVIPFGPEVQTLISTSFRFGAGFHFNGLFYGILSHFFSHEMSILSCTSLFMAMYIMVFFLTPDPVRACGHTAMLFLLTSPTVHPWYGTTLALFSVLYPVKSWISLTGLLSLSWIVIFRYYLNSVWYEPKLLLFYEFTIPLIFAFLSRWRLLEFRSPGFGKPQKISVIIPMLNEESRITECLASIHYPEELQGEILVVDGGSTDSSLTIAARDPRIKVISSDKGRGNQIAHGVQYATGDLVIVVHADTRLSPQCITEIFDYCIKHPWVSGGSLASCFDSTSIRYVFITMLNNLRSRYSRISFGDQVQFFRPAALQNGFPALKLMEDIELSLLLKEIGPVIVLPLAAYSSVRRWGKSNYLVNMWLVIYLTSKYIILRRFGLINGEGEVFHKAYYGPKFVN